MTLPLHAYYVTLKARIRSNTFVVIFSPMRLRVTIGSLIHFEEAFWGLSKIGCQPKSTSRGLGFSFQSAITVRRLSLIRHSNAPSARTTSILLTAIRVNTASFFIMGFYPFLNLCCYGILTD